MQAFGSWFKIPIVAIILQAILFGIIHVQYNIMGMICILTSGIIYGFVTWYTKGLEVSSALHAVNNFTAFIGTLLAVASTSGNMSGMGTFIQN
ncbi:CPBP family intramembrane glutamic endopeptidase [Methanobrevibacter sp.]|uniref:CPBP family intramembrane glutamic endopeptidase n=1 Tax=Methanobrevibacter sp. TaxID=66852 RepID=UPI003890DF4C